MALALASLLGLPGCGSDEAEEQGKQDPVEAGKTPPSDPGGPAAGGSDATTLAVRTIQLGDTDLDGQPNPEAWETIGYNLDGILSTVDGANHCALQRGANARFVKTDGEDGIDNSFGANLMPILSSVSSDVSALVNGSLETGDFTILLHLRNLEDAASQSGIDASLYGGGVHKDCKGEPPLGTPCWDGSDVWPVSFESVNGGDLETPKVDFPSAYMTGGTWVSGSKGDIELIITVEGYELNLNIRNALVTMELEGTGGDASAVNGVIAGILDTAELIESLRKVAGSINTSLCQGSTFDGIAAQILASSDIMTDGTNGDSSRTCNGISVGMGFQAQAVLLGEVADPIEPAKNPCETGQ